MPTKLIKSSAQILGGSAIAGIGFSFGRDVYKKAKKPGTKNTIIALLVLGGAVIGTYTGGVWLARNYETIWGSIFKRIGGVVIMVPSFVLLLALASFFVAAFSASEDNQGDDTQEIAETVAVYEPSATDQAATEDLDLSGFYPPALEAYYLPSGILLIGLVAGAFQRKKRQVVWEAEHANEQFMKDHGLIEHEDETIEEESTGQHYRIEHLGTKRITLFPIGKRGKRAYININPDGKYSEFTGIKAKQD